MLIRLASVASRKLAHLLELWHERGFSAVRDNLRDQLLGAGPDPARTPAEFLKRFEPTPELLARFRRKKWPADAPIFTLSLAPDPTATETDRDACSRSIREQTYPHWELLDATEGTGTFAARLNPKVRLAPHALHRFAEAILASDADILFADGAVAGTDPDDILGIAARPAFSYDHYLTHPDLGDPVFVRTARLREVGGWESGDDPILRLLEVGATVAHIPDVLSRSAPAVPPDVEAGRSARERHFARLGLAAEVVPDRWNPGFYDVRFPVDPAARVAIVIPTKNRVDLLRPCLESLERTTDPRTVEITVLDHGSDDPATLAYFREIAARHRIVPVTGPFNFAALMNQGIAAIRGEATHYLFLNNDTLAPEPGWLDRMLGLACRPDVGAVGATLIFPDGTIQHAGITTGALGGADHVYRNRPLHRNGYERSRADGGMHLASRDVAAVTAACLLIRAELFHRLNGFDERFAVEFNDVDLCLRVRAAGYKVIQDGRAVLFHFEGRSRGTERIHWDDIDRFVETHRALLDAGDPFASPLHSMRPDVNALQPFPVPPAEVRPRTVRVKVG